jgi:hypothetical protein
MRRYVESETKVGYDKHWQEVYDGRLQNYAVQALKDLAFLAEKLPEEQLAEIFNVKEMRPFFNALFKIEIQAKSHEEWLQLKSSKEMKVKRKRLLELSKAVLETVGNGMFVLPLLSESFRPFIKLGIAEPENLKFVLYAQTEE